MLKSRAIRAFVMTAVAVLVLVAGLFTTPAQAVDVRGASTVSTSAVSTATPKAFTSVNVSKRKADTNLHWWGFSVDFDRAETRGIAAGVGSCSVVVGKLPSVVAKILSAACGLLTVYAGYTLSAGRCLRVSRNWAQFGLSIGSWNC